MKTKHPRASQSRVLVITGTWPPLRCGVGDYTHALTRALADQDMDIHVITSRAACGSESKVHVHPRIKDWTWGIMPQIQHAVEELKPKIVHVQWPTAVYGRSLAVNWLPVYLRRHFPHIPLVTTLHEFRYFKPWTRWRVYPALQGSTRVILVDPLDLDWITRRLPQWAGRCSHVPIGSNLPSVPQSFAREKKRRELGLAPKDFVIAFFGFANPPKGLEDLLDALAARDLEQPQVRLLLLSQLNSEVAYHRQLLRRLQQGNLASRTVRPPYADPSEAAQILACADCAVLPFRDGVSLKRGSLLACLAQGLAVITRPPEPGPLLPFKANENILYAESPGPAALARAIQHCQQDAKLRRRISQGARELSRQFDWRAIARHHQQLYHTILEGSH